MGRRQPEPIDPGPPRWKPPRRKPSGGGDSLDGLTACILLGIIVAAWTGMAIFAR